MTPQEARALVAAQPAAREQWLTETVEGLQAQAVWLAGSMGRGQADEWSDVDLIVVGGSPDLSNALVATDNPGNGPAGGGYVGALYDIGPLTLWADWYVWPSREPVPSDARLLRGRGNQGTRDLSESLNRIGRGRPRPHPDENAFALAMLPLAAKFVARGENDKAVSMAVMLGAPPGTGALNGLRVVLSAVRGHDKTRILVDRYLQVVEALVPS